MIRDTGSRIQGSKRHRIPDPGSGSATQVVSVQDSMHGKPAASDRVLLHSQVLLPGPHDQRSRDQSPWHWGFLCYILNDISAQLCK
jgi:hypothetical protein